MTDQTALPPVPGIVDLHARLAAGETLYGAFAGLGSPVAVEIMARSGFDWLLLDLEHGAGTESELLASLHAMGATPAAALVRPQSGERLRIGRALDLGAHGIMVPRVDLPEQAREAISFMRYPPDGARGLALSTRGAGLGELGHTQIQAINRRILGIIQIESPERRRARRRDRRHRWRRRPVRRPDRPVAQPRGPRRLRRSGLSRCHPPRRHDRRVGREGRRDPAARRVVAGAPPRPRVPVHRARLGRGVHQRRRAGRHGRHPRLSRQPSTTSASSGVAGSGAPRGRGAVWAMITPTRTSPAPSSWIGASR